MAGVYGVCIDYEDSDRVIENSAEVRNQVICNVNIFGYAAVSLFEIISSDINGLSSRILKQAAVNSGILNIDAHEYRAGGNISEFTVLYSEAR